jgi:hypothetical protein
MVSFNIHMHDNQLVTYHYSNYNLPENFSIPVSTMGTPVHALHTQRDQDEAIHTQISDISVWMYWSLQNV